MPGDGYAVSGEDLRQLPLTDPDRRRASCGAQAGFGQVLLYIQALDTRVCGEQLS
jgi:hypothetical protein